MASDLVWTNHLQERLAQRGVTRNEAYDTIRYPSKSIRLSPDKWKLIKDYSGKQVTLIAVNKNNQWIILTAWSRQPGRDSHSTSTEPLISRLVRNLIVKLVSAVQSLLQR